MKSLKDKVENEIIIEKSRFITYLFPINNNSEAKEFIQEIKKLYPDASHVVYGFLLSNEARSNDDNEPKGTAGIPTLEVLRKNDLVNVLAITVRYFGGIKLGAGGLVRAYTKGVSEALKKASITELKKVIEFKITLSYKDSSYLEKNLGHALDFSKSFSDVVIYDIRILEENFSLFKEALLGIKNEYKLEVIKEEEVFIWWKRKWYFYSFW